MTGQTDRAEDARERTRRMLDFFVRLFLALAVLGAALAVAYGLSAGTERAGVPRSPAVPPHMQAIGPQPGTAQHPLTAAVLAISICGGAAALGGAAGFLFGLPRTLASGAAVAAAVGGARDAAPDGGGSPSPLATNTNLEQISDWLTKIIVGVGLTKLEEVPAAIESFGDKVDHFFGFGGKVFGISGGLYFLTIGFFVGYVLTRTKLTWIFIGSDREGDRIIHDYDEAVDRSAGEPVDPRTIPLRPPPGGPPGGAPAQALPSAASLAAAEGPAATVPAEVLRSDRTVLGRSLAEASSTMELAARAAAEARSGQLQTAAVLYADVVKADPASPHLADYVSVLGALGNKSAAATMIARLRTVAPSQQGEARRKMLIGLLRAGLYNGKFEDSIAAGEELVARPDETEDGWARLWLACAYGQRHGVMKVANPADPQLGPIADRAVALLTEAVSIDPDLKPLIASLYKPGEQSGGDDDLTSLWQEPRIDALLAG